MDLATYIDRFEEGQKFKRWLTKRKGVGHVDDFTSDILDSEEKRALKAQWANDVEIDELLNRIGTNGDAIPGAG